MRRYHLTVHPHRRACLRPLTRPALHVQSEPRGRIHKYACTWGRTQMLLLLTAGPLVSRTQDLFGSTHLATRWPRADACLVPFVWIAAPTATWRGGGTTCCFTPGGFVVVGDRPRTELLITYGPLSTDGLLFRAAKTGGGPHSPRAAEPAL